MGQTAVGADGSDNDGSGGSQDGTTSLLVAIIVAVVVVMLAVAVMGMYVHHTRQAGGAAGQQHARVYAQPVRPGNGSATLNAVYNGGEVLDNNAGNFVGNDTLC